MTPLKASLPEGHGISTPLVPDLARRKVVTPDPEVRYPETEFVQCFRHEGDECPRRDGLYVRPRPRCGSCNVPAGRPSRGGKALSPGRSVKSREELRFLPLYCMDCNPRFLRTRLVFFEEMGS